MPSMTSTFRRLAGASCATLAIALLLAAARPAAEPGRAATWSAQAQSASFAVIPCEDKAWTKRDPTFEPLNGSRVYSGEYAGGLYRVEIPANWNGELVLFAHGHTAANGPDGLVLRIPNTPLRAHFVEKGFAWAASSFRCNGYIPGQAVSDTLALKALFQKLNDGSAPRRTYLMGASMGGHAALVAAHALPTAFDGTLALCPSAPEIMDYFAAVGAAAEVITDVTVTRDSLQDNLKAMNEALGKPPAYTDKGRQLASVQIHLSGGPRPFAVEGLEERFAPNVATGADILVNAPTPWYRIATNTGVAYRIDEQLGLSANSLNTRARRKPGGAGLRTLTGPYRDAVAFDGRLARPVMTMHTTGDMLVPISLVQGLQRAVNTARRENLLVQRVYRAAGHCTFSAPETRAAFDDFVTWARGGQKPAGDDVLGDLSDAGRRFTNPLRPGDPGTINIR